MGFELYTQPTVFYGPVSALGGFYPATGAGSLSGEYTAFFETWSYFGDGVTTKFSIYSDQLVLPYSENFIVNIDGVVQNPSKYTIDAIYKNIDFSDPVPNGSELTIIQIATLVNPNSVPIVYATSHKNWQYTGNGLTDTYSVATTGVLVPNSENYIVSIDGVVQVPTTYTINTSAATIQFDTPVPNSSNLSITQIASLRRDTYSFYSYDFNSWSFSVTAVSQNLFTLSASPVDLSPQQGAYIVSIDGVIQAPNIDFSIDVNTRTLAFTSPVLSGSLVRVQQLGSLGVIIEDDIKSKYFPLSGGTVNGSLSATQGIRTNTLTSTNINTTNLIVTNLTATNNVVTNIFVVTADSSITFTDAYNSKIVHLDTTITPVITASFPKSLKDGFNVGLVNVGTGIIRLSSDDTINAFGNYNSIQYTGMLIYKTNNKFFGIGAFE